MNKDPEKANCEILGLVQWNGRAMGEHPILPLLEFGALGTAKMATLYSNVLERYKSTHYVLLQRIMPSILCSPEWQEVIEMQYCDRHKQQT